MQFSGTHTVTVVTLTTDTDDLGDSTTTTLEQDAAGVLFAPEGIAESTSSRSPAVIGDATLYGPLPKLNADDTVRHEPTCCTGAEFDHGVWQVVGGSRGWGPGQVAAPIQRTGSV